MFQKRHPKESGANCWMRYQRDCCDKVEVLSAKGKTIGRVGLQRYSQFVEFCAFIRLTFAAVDGVIESHIEIVDQLPKMELALRNVSQICAHLIKPLKLKPSPRVLISLP